MNLLGKRVETAVWVCGERKAMYQGIVVEDDDSGVIKVDVCPTGAPWIHYEDRSHVRVIEPQSETGEKHG